MAERSGRKPLPGPLYRRGPTLPALQGGFLSAPAAGSAPHFLRGAGKGSGIRVGDPTLPPVPSAFARRSDFQASGILKRARTFLRFAATVSLALAAAGTAPATGTAYAASDTALAAAGTAPAASTALAAADAVPAAPGAAGFDFVALGDTPYSARQDAAFGALVERINALAPPFSVHVGDIKGSGAPCTEEYFRHIRDRFDAFASALVYTPGDNEWTDCKPGAGGLTPAASLHALRAIFFATPARSLGRRPLALLSQADLPAPAGSAKWATVENARWTHQGVGFATFNVPGCGDGWDDQRPFPGQERHWQAVLAWLRATFDAAEQGQKALVLLAQAEPWDVLPQCVHAYGGWLEALRAAVLRYGRPVLLVHGDQHTFRFDNPWAGSPQPVPNFRRLEVCGSPAVGAVVVHVEPDAQDVFSVKQRLLEFSARNARPGCRTEDRP